MRRVRVEQPRQGRDGGLDSTLTDMAAYRRLPAFAFCPALVFKRDCSYISIHCSLEIDEMSFPIALRGKSSADWKCTQHFPMSSFLPDTLKAIFSCASWFALQNAPMRYSEQKFFWAASAT